MKNLAKLVGIIAFVVVIGFLFAACTVKEVDLNGTTWSNNNYVLTFNNPNVRYTEVGDESYTGTYSVSGNKVTLIILGDTEEGTLSGNTLSIFGEKLTKQ